MTVKQLFDFIKGVRPGIAFTDAQLTVWLNEIEGHVQTDIWLLEPAVDETQTGLVEYDSTIDPETGEMVDANRELLVPFPWNKLYRYFLLMSIDLANGEYQRYANSYELFNEAYEEYAGWYAQHVSPANGEAITRGYYISAYQFAARGGYTGTEKEFYETLGKIHYPITASDLSPDVLLGLGSATFYNVQQYDILPDTGEELYYKLFDFLHDVVYPDGGIVYFPVGQYRLGNTILIPPNTVFMGEGRGTEIKFTGAISTSFGVALSNGGDNVGIVNMTINDKNTEPLTDKAATGGIGFGTYDFTCWTEYNMNPRLISPHRNTKNLIAENLWSDTGYLLQTEESPTSSDPNQSTITNVLYRNIYAPHSRVSLYGRQHVRDAVIENVTCAVLRIGNKGKKSLPRSILDVRIKNVTAGHARIYGRNVDIDGLTINPAYKYDIIGTTCAVLLSSDRSDSSNVTIRNARIDATGYKYAFYRENSYASLINVTCSNYDFAWGENSNKRPRVYFTNCNFGTKNVPKSKTITGISINGQMNTQRGIVDYPARTMLTRKTPKPDANYAVLTDGVSGAKVESFLIDINGTKDDSTTPPTITCPSRVTIICYQTDVYLESQSQTYNVPLPSAAGNVYRGTLDAATGEVTVYENANTTTGTITVNNPPKVYWLSDKYIPVLVTQDGLNRFTVQNGTIGYLKYWADRSNRNVEDGLEELIAKLYDNCYLLDALKEQNVLSELDGTMKTKPITRREMFLAAITDTITLPTPASREELYLAKIAGESVTIPETPETRYETYLAKIAGQNVVVPRPHSRLEYFLYRACGYEAEALTPISREEIFWARYIGVEISFGPGDTVVIQDAVAGPPISAIITMEPIQTREDDPGEDNPPDYPTPDYPITLSGWTGCVLTRCGASVSDNPMTYEKVYGETVYSGSYNVLNDTLVSAYGIEILDGTETWTAASGNAYMTGYVVSGFVAPSSRGVNSTGWCSHFVVCTDINGAELAQLDDDALTYSNSSVSGQKKPIVEYHVTGEDGVERRATADELKTFLNNNEVQLVYKRDTPYTPSPGEPVGFELLAGVNTLTCNCGTLTLKYMPNL